MPSTKHNLLMLLPQHRQHRQKNQSNPEHQDNPTNQPPRVQVIWHPCQPVAKLKKKLISNEERAEFDLFKQFQQFKTSSTPANLSQSTNKHDQTVPDAVQAPAKEKVKRKKKIDTYGPKEAVRRGSFAKATPSCSNVYNLLTAEQKNELRSQFVKLDPKIQKAYVEKLKKTEQRFFERKGKHKPLVGEDGLPIKYQFKEFMRIHGDFWNPLRTTPEEKERTRQARKDKMKAESEARREAKKLQARSQNSDHMALDNTNTQGLTTILPIISTNA